MARLSPLRCTALAFTLALLSSCNSMNTSSKPTTGAAMVATDAGQTAAAGGN